MANLPSQHPHLSLHLSDRALTPLITSARTQYQLDALTSLSHGALSAHESALRLGLGTPQRIVVEHAGSGPVVLQSFLRADPRPSSSSSATTAAAAAANSTTNAPPSPSPHTHPHTPSGHNTNTFPPPTPGTSTPAPPNGLGLNLDNNLPPSSDPSTPVSPSASPTTTAIERRLAQLQLQHGTSTAATTSNSVVGVDDPASPEDANAPPMLVGLVVSPSADEARDARRAAARLERVGREIQARWAEAHAGPDEDGHGQGQGQGGATSSGVGVGDTGD